MSKVSKVVIYGDTTLAEVAHFYLKNDSPYEVVAFTVDREYLKKDELLGLPVVPFEEIETLYPSDDHYMFVAIGFSGVNGVRKDAYLKAKAKGYRFASYVSSKATVWTEDIGDNCLILEDNTIQPFVHIGDNVVLWSGNHIGHHSTIEDHCFVSSHCVISGGCVVKERSFLGVNSTLRDGITVAEENVIGAGAIILKSTQPQEVFAAKGTPLFPKASYQLRGM